MTTFGLEGTTYTLPTSSGVGSSTVTIGRRLLRSRIEARWLGRRGSRCCASTTGALKSSPSEPTSTPNASIPPAEAPTTTRLSDFAFSVSTSSLLMLSFPWTQHPHLRAGRESLRLASVPFGPDRGVHCRGRSCPVRRADRQRDP